MIIKVKSILYTSETDEIVHIQNAQIEVSDSGKITGIGKETHIGGINLRKYIALPQFLNAHVHVQDYFLRRYFKEMYIDDVVGAPYGIKYVLLRKANRDIIEDSIEKALDTMYRSGTGFSYVVVEYGLQNLDLVNKILKKYPINIRLFLEPSKFHITQECQINYDIIHEVNEIVERGYDVELVSPLNYTIEELENIEKIVHSRSRMIMTHVSETEDTFNENDIDISIDILRADLLVHCIYVEDFRRLKDKIIVVTPRSNIELIGKICDIDSAVNYCKVYVGTDNVGLVEPNMWDEAKVLISIDLNPRMVFKLLFPREISQIENLDSAKLQIVQSYVTHHSIDKILRDVFITGKCIGRIDSTKLILFY